MSDNKNVTVQSLLQKMLLDNESDNDNETLQLMEFVRDNGVPLNNTQARGLFLLQEMGLDDMANYFINVRPMLTPFKKFTEFVNKLTLADRIKGNAKLSGILKANANPANGLNVDKALGKQGGGV